MNSRLVKALVLLCCAWMLAAATLNAPAQAEWYRPLTWGDKKPSSGQHRSQRSGMVGGTKRALSRTADALTPWDNDKKQDNPVAGAGRFFRPDLAHKRKENEATWYRPATWFREAAQEKKPLTVTDWMDQDRPEFENR